MQETMKSFKILEHDTLSSQTTEVVFTVVDSASDEPRTVIQTAVENNKRRHDFRKYNPLLLIQNIKTTLRIIFLPLNYPDSVHPGYIQYQFYDSLQGLCSYLRSIASTTAVLSAAGVGDSQATVTSAVITWATNDGCAMIGGLIFSYYASGYFDSNVKEWRLFADVINDVGLTLEMFLPHLDKSYIPVVSMIAALCKVMCGTAAGATKSCITQHFAKDNIADLTAKESIQETFVSLMGMILGISLAKSLQTMQRSSIVLASSTKEGSEWEGDILLFSSDWWYIHSPMIATWLVFGILTWIHIWSNYIAVKMLKLRTLNRIRLKVALHKVVEQGVRSMMKNLDISMTNHDAGVSASCSGSEFRRLLISPQDCNERLLDGYYSVIRPDSIRLGVRLSTVLKKTKGNISSSSSSSCTTISSTTTWKEWMLSDKRHVLFLNNDYKMIYICLHENATDDDILKAYVHGMMLQCYLNKVLRLRADAGRHVATQKKFNVDTLIQRTMEWTNVICEEGELWNDLVDRGWIRSLYLNCEKWRYSISSKCKKKMI